MNGILKALLQQFIIPEITKFVQARLEGGQPAPTDEEVFSMLRENANAGILDGEAFLALKGALGD